MSKAYVDEEEISLLKAPKGLCRKFAFELHPASPLELWLRPQRNALRHVGVHAAPKPLPLSY
jgi:hypothetical protein